MQSSNQQHMEPFLSALDAHALAAMGYLRFQHKPLFAFAAADALHTLHIHAAALVRHVAPQPAPRTRHHGRALHAWLEAAARGEESEGAAWLGSDCRKYGLAHAFVHKAML